MARSFAARAGYIVDADTTGAAPSFAVGGAYFVSEARGSTVEFIASGIDSLSADTVATITLGLGDSTTGESVVVITAEDIDTATFSSVTIAGSAATQLVFSRESDKIVAIYAAVGVTAASGDVVVTLSQAETGTVAVTSYRVDAPASIIAPADTGSDSGETASQSFNLTVPESGVALCGYVDGSADSTATWTNATELTDFATGGTSSHRHSTAFLTTEGEVAITITASTGTSNAAAGVSWGSAGRSGVIRLALAEAERRRATVYHRQQEALRYNREAIRLQNELAEKKARLAEEEKNKNAESKRADGLRKQAAALEAKLAKIVERERRRIEAELALQIHNAEVMTVLAAVM